MEKGPRLVGWKEITRYVQRSVKTCKKYADTLGMPVVRVGGLVEADRDELDRWRADQGRDLGRTVDPS